MKRLYRSRTQRVIGGVAGGLGEYLDLDPVLVRILFVVVAFAGGSGIIAYIIAWIIIPEQPGESPMSTPNESQQPATPPPAPKPEAPPQRGSVVGGLILVVMGLLFLGDQFIPHFRFGDWWPLILVAIGAGMLYRSVRPSNS